MVHALIASPFLDGHLLLKPGARAVSPSATTRACGRPLPTVRLCLPGRCRPRPTCGTST